MNPNYENAAMKAVDTIIRFNVDTTCIDPLPILNKLPNVLLIAYSATEMTDEPQEASDSPILGDNQDAVTLVSKKDGKIRYIIIYNRNLPDFQLRLALSRELAHVILEHDGSAPEYVWLEEANCFAHHFLCPLSLTHPIKKSVKVAKYIQYRPKRQSTLWELKSIQPFESLDEMKIHVAYERNQHNRIIGKTDVVYEPKDVKIIKCDNDDHYTNWTNFCDIVVDGEVVGHCGA